MNKRLHFSCAILLWITLISELAAQAPNWLWSKRFGSSTPDYVSGIGTDYVGNSYICGSFNGGTLTIGSSTMISAGYNDMFVAKLDSNGTPLWASSAGGSQPETAVSIAVDSAGFSYVTGNYSSSMITFGGTTLLNNGYYDVYVVKYSPSGTVVWARNFGGSDDDKAGGIATDANGNVYFTGSFSGTAVFGNTTLISNGYKDIYLAKLNSSGQVVWATSVGGAEMDGGGNLCVDKIGNTYLTGDFGSSSITFGTTTLLNSSNANPNFYVAKFDPTGIALWAKGVSTGTLCTGSGIGVDKNGNVFVSGSFSSPIITFGAISLANNSNGLEAFLIKLDAAGNIKWAKTVVGSGSHTAGNLAVDKNGTMCFTGNFVNTIVFGTTTLTSAGAADIFLAKLDSAGNGIWAKSVGGTSLEQTSSATMDDHGVCHISGVFYSSSLTFGPTTHNNSGLGDIFVAKIGPVIETNIEVSSLDPGFRVYPNPCLGSFNTFIPETFGSGKLELENLLGQKVLSQDVFPGDNTVLVSSLPQGIYTCRITGEINNISCKKLILK